jgi:hypothetical protein
MRAGSGDLQATGVGVHELAALSHHGSCEVLSAVWGGTAGVTNEICYLLSGE